MRELQDVGTEIPGEVPSGRKTSTMEGEGEEDWPEEL